MATGSIKRLVRDKGFGFITPDAPGEDVFFHRSQLAPRLMFENLREGDQVEYEVTEAEKGPQAQGLRLR